MANEMRPDDVEVPLYTPGDVMHARSDPSRDASLGELFRRLTSDTTDLLRQEVELAKAEMRETAARLGKDAARAGVGIGLALAGGLALTAFLVIGLGNVLGGRYWLSALIVGVAFAGIGYSMLKGAMNDVTSTSITPQQSVESLREDAQWAKQEARAFKHELTTPPSDVGSSSHASSPRP
jgi:uncharacterized membrane protein YqjE